MLEIMAAKAVITQEELDIVELVQGAVFSIRPAAHTKGLKVQCGFAPSLGAVVGDAQRLRRMLSLLLDNAVKFTDQDAHIKVLVSREGPHIRIDIEVSGMGIEKDMIPILFERFRQADSSRKYGGLGLGLTIALQIAEAHGGRIEATSRGLGEGATFSTWLALAPATFGLR